MLINIMWYWHKDRQMENWKRWVKKHIYTYVNDCFMTKVVFQWGEERYLNKWVSWICIFFKCLELYLTSSQFQMISDYNVKVKW